MNNDIKILRELARQVREIAENDWMHDLRAQWKRHNGLKDGRAMICVSPEGSWAEILPEESLTCAEPLYREMEAALRRSIYWARELRDDTPIAPWYNLPYVTGLTGYIDGVSEVKELGENRGSFHYKKLVEDIRRDMPKLRFRQVTYDEALNRSRLEMAAEAIGDLLPVRHRGIHWWTIGITSEVIKLIGLEELMIDMYDDPEALHELMDWFRREHMHLIEQYRDLGLLTLNNEEDLIASGGIGCTDELPTEGFRQTGKVDFADLWGFSESQETVGVSPQMFGEFVFPYQLPLLERFGINCYGCCEPVEARWEWIRTIPRLRRLSVSPWSDREQMAEILGKRYIFSRKPNPSPVCMGFDEEEIRRELSTSLALAGRTHMEIILKDTHTVENQPQRLCRWVEIARELAAKVE